MTVGQISIQNKGRAYLLVPEDGSFRITPAVIEKYRLLEVQQIELSGGVLYVETYRKPKVKVETDYEKERRMEESRWL